MSVDITVYSHDYLPGEGEDHELVLLVEWEDNKFTLLKPIWQVSKIQPE